MQVADDNGSSPAAIVEESRTPASIDADTICGELVKGLEKGGISVKFDGSSDFDNVDKAVNRVISEHPEYFWISGYDVRTTRRSTEIKLWTVNNISESKIPEMQKKLSNAADCVIASMPPNIDDYEKVVFVHDYIVEHTDYDSAVLKSENYGFSGTAYGCLIDGKAICQGYSLAFLYIMQKLGIECGMVSGYTGSISHAWNYVTLNGKSYWVDTTWDDPSFADAGFDSISHAYCLIDDEMLLKTRRINKDGRYIPECRWLDDNYFVRSRAYFTSYDPDQMMQVIAASAYTDGAEMMFNSSELLESAIENLFTNGDYWYFAADLGAGETVSYYIDDRMNILKLIY